MISYLSEDTYVVCYSKGTGGAFISSLIYEFIKEPKNVIPIGDRGDAHQRAKYYINNWRIDKSKGKTFPTYKNITPINPSLPLIIQQHEFPALDADRDFLFTKFPNCKLIFITFTETDIADINSNIENKLNTDPVIKKENLNIDYQYLNLNLPNDSKITVIKFRDIFYNPNLVLNILSNITKRPINNLVQESYKQYIDKQSYAIS